MVMSDDAIELVLQKWAWAKGEEAAMKKTIEMCKTQVEKALKERGSMEIITDNYEVKKSMRKTEHVSKKDLPAAIWSKYAKTSEFSVLAFKSKKAMKSAAKAPKAKAKAKAKSSAKTMKSNK
ncbi:unnamed protein product [Cladocopium goreaui]|uniref:Uncharacterized protein n=1 Tax=Cladocopium goreaui TaxID=2562237 RepID=A0A9P1GPX3_9DINO|nr:unnamed protein product [Cladocopium goreaui]|mmetsp:Transcript_34831/g.75180  ORF Transcript_34831/g.75180 Transcript_34831/m.75180 type:complete len:122 (+) Transcript_34831:84-449(+)